GEEPVRIWHTTGVGPGHHGGMRYRHVDSPVGRIRLSGRDDGVLTGLHLADHDRCPPAAAGWTYDDTVFGGARQQLDEYFAGMRTDFDVPLDLRGSAFQVAVWRALCAIPYGETTSYAD